MIQSVNRALEILEHVAKHSGAPQTSSEISAALGLNRATASNIIRTLLDKNYLEQEGARKGYTLGIMCDALGSEESFQKRLGRIAEPLMKELAAASGETVILAVLRNDKRFVLQSVEGGQALQVRSGIVSDSKVFDTATGRLLISALPEKELCRIIRGGGLSKSKSKEIKDSAAGIKEAGHYIHTGYKNQVVGVAFAVQSKGRTAAALGLYLPAFRFNGEHREKVMRGMKNAAVNISNNI